MSERGHRASFDMGMVESLFAFCTTCHTNERPSPFPCTQGTTPLLLVHKLIIKYLYSGHYLHHFCTAKWPVYAPKHNHVLECFVPGPWAIAGTVAMFRQLGRQRRTSVVLEPLEVAYSTSPWLRTCNVFIA